MDKATDAIKNFCVKLEDYRQIESLENVLAPFRPSNDNKFGTDSNFSLYDTPYFGVKDNEMTYGPLPWEKEIEPGELAQILIAITYEKVMKGEMGSITPPEGWRPIFGETVYGSMLDDSKLWKDAIYLYTDANTQGQIRHYCISANSITKETNENGQRIVPLIGFKHIKPRP